MYHQTEVIASGLMFAKTEGILPAPEAAHAIKETVDQALLAKENNEKKNIVFLSKWSWIFRLVSIQRIHDW